MNILDTFQSVLFLKIDSDFFFRKNFQVSTWNVEMKKKARQKAMKNFEKKSKKANSEEKKDTE